MTEPYGYQQDGVPPYGAPPSWAPPAVPYGMHPGYPIAYQPYPQPPTNGVGVAGFVTGLVGLVLFWIPVLGFLLAATGIVLSSVGMSQGKRTGASTGLTIAGLVCGIVGAVPAVFFVLPALLFGF